MALRNISAIQNFLIPQAADGSSRQVYVVVDTARDDSIYPGLRNLVEEWRCLYKGESAVHLASCAPYLIAVKPNMPLLRWLLLQGWGESWGIFLESEASLDDLRSHLRLFLQVRDESRRLLNFRFYDPRVLRPFLPTCSSEQLELLFGPITAFRMEGEETETLVEFTRQEEHLLQRTSCWE